MRIEDRGSHIVITSADDVCTRPPLGCPVCDVVMCIDDITQYKMYGCCDMCFRTWVEGRVERWRMGWRPSDDDIAEMRDRNFLSRRRMRV